MSSKISPAMEKTMREAGAAMSKSANSRIQPEDEAEDLDCCEMNCVTYKKGKRWMWQVLVLALLIFYSAVAIVVFVYGVRDFTGKQDLFGAKGWFVFFWSDIAIIAMWAVLKIGFYSRYSKDRAPSHHPWVMYLPPLWVVSKLVLSLISLVTIWGWENTEPENGCLSERNNDVRSAITYFTGGNLLVAIWVGSEIILMGLRRCSRNMVQSALRERRKRVATVDPDEEMPKGVSVGFPAAAAAAGRGDMTRASTDDDSD